MYLNQRFDDFGLARSRPKVLAQPFQDAGCCRTIIQAK